MSSSGLVGKWVKVKAVQERLGKPLFPGRIGFVQRDNSISDGTVVYVRLNPTGRANGTVECLAVCDLEVIDE